MTLPNNLPSSPIRYQARPKPAALPLVTQERLHRTWYNVCSGPWRGFDLPRVEIVRLDLGYTLVDLPRTWFEFRDIEQRRMFLDRQVHPWKAGTAPQFKWDPPPTTPLLGSGLFFDGSGKIKYLRVYPSDWSDRSDEQLLELFEQAVPV